MTCVRRNIFFYSCFLLLAELGHGQQVSSKEDIQTSVKECRVIQLTLNTRARLQANPNDRSKDNFTAAGQACDQLNQAISTSDPAKIQPAAASVRAALARIGAPPASPREQLAALEEAIPGFSEEELFSNLPDLAKRAFNAGEIDKARTYSNQLLRMTSKYPKNWNEGNAVYYGNFVLGRIAVREGNLAQAGKYLMAAAATSGSPQLDTFGPNMTLAKDLLEKGQSEVVLQYLALCKNFWKMDDGKLDKWSATIRSGGTPDFSDQLNY